jgi:hypothetical protein
VSVYLVNAATLRPAARRLQDALAARMAAWGIA